MTEQESKADIFAKLQYDVEHALSVYADSYVTLPGAGIYDDEMLAKYHDVIKRCHIYIIGFTPKVNLDSVNIRGGKAVIELSVLGKTYEIEYPVPGDFVIRSEGCEHFFENSVGKRYTINMDDLMCNLRDVASTEFRVKYVGQAYGRDGSRNALDRLMSHETLQKIALKKPPDGYDLQLVLVEVKTSTQVVTMFNPHAQDASQGDERISAGLDKLFNTSEIERISLYEAALIRYFMPEFNKEFKDSFPSTNLKILQDCYNKDFSAVAAEFYFDKFPYLLGSEIIKPAFTHIAWHNLHDEPSRKAFFAV